VAHDGSNNVHPFDLRTIKILGALMSRHDLSEIDLSEGPARIRLRRGPRGKLTVTTPTAQLAQVAPSPSPSTSAGPKPEEPAKPAKHLVPIKSPAVGTYYAASAPGAEPFVKVGSRVERTTVVCIIEAMKILNEIQAECSGVITEILVANQEPVEYGQVLFQVDPTG
jgi:acetyl-CoA carboxylase biotin carboxyl carrier protein